MPGPLPFSARFRALARERGPFCLNLDPTPNLLRAWAMPEGTAGLELFCERVVEVAAPRTSVIKPQSAYFERFGPSGFDVLQRTIAAIQNHGALALLDAKRGDIGSTNQGYADGLLGPDSPMRADALTVHVYLGFAALAPLVERAGETGGALFPVVLSSNPEGRALQSARLPGGESVAEALAAEITACNATRLHENLGPVGAVVGVTAPGVPELLERMPHSLILAPGLGAQGGTVADIAQRFAPARGRVLPSAGRSVLAAGPSVDALAKALDEICEATRRALA